LKNIFEKYTGKIDDCSLCYSFTCPSNMRTAAYNVSNLADVSKRDDLMNHSVDYVSFYLNFV
jgi:hypothetical protein